MKTQRALERPHAGELRAELVALLITAVSIIVKTWSVTAVSITVKMWSITAVSIIVKMWSNHCSVIVKTWSGATRIHSHMAVRDSH